VDLCPILGFIVFASALAHGWHIPLVLGAWLAVVVLLQSLLMQCTSSLCPLVLLADSLYMYSMSAWYTTQIGCEIMSLFAVLAGLGQ
jgi:hypothetical protein